MQEIDTVNQSIDEIAQGAKALVSTFFEAFMIYEDHLRTIAEAVPDTTSGEMAQKALDEVKALMKKPVPPWEQPEFVEGVNNLVQECIDDGYIKVVDIPGTDPGTDPGCPF